MLSEILIAKVWNVFMTWNRSSNCIEMEKGISKKRQSNVSSANENYISNISILTVYSTRLSSLCRRSTIVNR